MEENKEVVTLNHNISPKFVSTIRADRFSRIFFNMSVTLMIIALFAALSTFILPFAQMFLVLIIFLIIFLMIVVTFGTIFTLPNNPIIPLWEFLQKAMDFEKVQSMLVYIVNAIPYICIAGLVCSVVSLLITVLNKSKREVGKIVALSIFIGILIIAIILYFVLGGSL